MTKLRIICYPDFRLFEKCRPIDMVDDETREFLDDMLETMYANKGVGLAAPQVGITRRIVVIDDKVGEEGEEGKNPYYMVNPQIVERSEEKVVCSEGCLSVPGQYADVVRHEWVKVEYLDYNNNPQTLKAEGFLAVIVQHELDHLDGVLYIDRISKLKKDVILRKLRKQQK